MQVSEQNHQLQDQLQEQMAKYQELEKRNAELPVRLQEEWSLVRAIHFHLHEVCFSLTVWSCVGQMLSEFFSLSSQGGRHD